MRKKRLITRSESLSASSLCRLHRPIRRPFGEPLYPHNSLAFNLRNPAFLLDMDRGLPDRRKFPVTDRGSLGCITSTKCYAQVRATLLSSCYFWSLLYQYHRLLERERE